MDALRVLVVDETPGLTQDLLLALRRRAAVQVLGPAVDAAAAETVIATERIDLVLVRLDRRDGEGIAIVGALRDGSAGRVMAALRHPVSPAIELALAAGACGVLPVRHDAETLIDAFRRACSGELVLPADELPALVDRVRDARARRAGVALVSYLTERERQVLAGVAEGETMAEIALVLGISRATVQSHMKNILGKLGVHSQVEAVGAAWRAGLAVASRSA
jgi:DNA-binding NarL/FixJ family response regulator